MEIEKAFILAEVINDLASPSAWLTAVEWIPHGFYFGDDGWIYLSDPSVSSYPMIPKSAA